MSNKVGISVTAKTKGVSQSLNSVSKSLKNVKKSTDSNGKSMGNWYNQTKKLNQKFVNLNKDANRTAGSINKLGDSFKKLAGTASLFALGKQLGKFIQSSIESIETTNLYNVALGEMADKASETVDKLSELYGLDSTNLKSAVGTYALLAKSMGMTSKQAEVLSTNTTRMALDLSSLMNIPIEQVMSDLKSGLVGQSETVYKYGMDVTEAGLKSEALAQGISKTVRNMNQGEKMALRYGVMIRNMNKDLGNGVTISGDFARTIDQPANQLKILAERFTTLGRSIGSIFIPMLTVVLPYLNALVQVIITVADAIAKLAGFKKDSDKATKSNGVASMAEDADGATTAIGGTTKALKDMKNATLGIDELNVMPKDTSSDSDGSGVGGASILPDLELPSLGELDGMINTKTSELVKKMQATATSIYDAFKKKDWDGIGSAIADGINSAVDYINTSSIFSKIDTGSEGVSTAFGGILNSAVENINWENLGILFGSGINSVISAMTSFITSIDFTGIGSAIAGFLNGAIETVDWLAIGELLALRFTTVVDLLYGFVTEFDFAGLGVAISDFINGAIGFVDWAKVGETISTGVKGLLKTLQEAIKNIDWKEIGTSIKDLLISIDWNGIIKELAYTVGLAIGGLALLLWGVIEDAVSAIGTYFTDMITLCGGDIVAGLLNGIVYALGSIVIWLFNNLVLPIINGVKDLFGIHSPSTVFEEIGDFLIQGLLGGLKSSWETITTFFTTVWETTKEIFQGAWDGVVEIWSVVSTWFDENVIVPIGEFFSTLGTNIISFFTKAWDAIVLVWKTVTKWYKDTVITPVTTLFKDIGITIAKFFSDAWDAIVLVWKTVNKWYKDTVITPVTNLFKDIGIAIAKFFSDSWDNIVGVWKLVDKWFTDNIITPVTTSFKTIGSSIYNFLKDAWDNIVLIWKDVKEWFKTTVTDPVSDVFKGMGNGIIGFFEAVVNGIIDGMNGVVGFVNGIADGINAVADKIGFSINLGLSTFGHVSIPKLERGGSLNAGQQFEAGENGKAEVIGAYQGKTTVMPLENSGFIEAMREAVYSAMIESQDNNGGTVIENVLNLDGETIYTNQQHVSSNRGINFGMGVFAR